MKKTKARFLLEATLILLVFTLFFYTLFKSYIQHLKDTNSKSILIKIINDIDHTILENTVITFLFSFSIYIAIKIVLWFAKTRELLTEKQSENILEKTSVIVLVTFIMLFLAIVLSETQFAFLTAYISFFVLIINFFNSKQ